VGLVVQVGPAVPLAAPTARAAADPGVVLVVARVANAALAAKAGVGRPRAATANARNAPGGRSRRARIRRRGGAEYPRRR